MSRDLLTEGRRHDLPPAWDGHPVTWRNWEKLAAAVFICPPPKIPAHCEVCGSVEEPLRNRGTVAPHPPLMPWILYVQRCPDCFTDLVWDLNDDQWWTLDHTDYGDTGSAPPVEQVSAPVVKRQVRTAGSAKDRALAKARAAVAQARDETLF